MNEDPRVQRPGVCRAIKIGSTGIEWICLAPVHAKVYQSRKGKAIFSNNPTVDRHYFVPRYPNRKKEDE